VTANEPLQVVRDNIIRSKIMRTIGKYEVVEKIGEGGFGSVFKGFDPHIRRFVAIKSCTSDEQEVRNRFFHEAQIAGNLQHRHIVTVYDFGLQDEVPYLVQEYLNGEDLDKKIKRKEFIPLPEKLLYLIQVARGLEYAHSRNVIHRDIKPANIRILEDGSARIMDFGIAKLANQDSGLTQTGMTLGTAAYLAPEQIKGEPVGPATDIFSWGVSAWELLAYQRPFGGQHISTVLYQVLNENPPSLRALAPDVPPEIEAVIVRCLEKKPEKRFANCTALLEAIDQTLQSRRLQAQAGFGALAADGSAAAEDTRSLPARSPAPGSAAASAPAGRPAAAASAAPGLGDFDLDATGDRTPHSISSTQAVRSRGFAWGRWAAGVMIGVALLLVAGAAVREAMVRRPATDEIATLDTAEAGEVMPGGAGGVTLAASAVGPTPTPLPTPTAEPTPEPTVAPTPTPQASYLVVPAAWSPDVYVTVNGERRSLARRQTFTVPAGDSRVKFDYRDGDYSDSKSRNVRVGEGASQEVEVAIGQPALLQIQPRVNTPPGRVILDGEDQGSRIVQKLVPPGSHKVRVEPAGAGATVVPIEQDVDVPAGKKVVVTFDLGGGTLVPVVVALPPSS
jgi:predicted Ser/Thr protein kinase